MVIKFRYQKFEKNQSAVFLVLFSLPNILFLLSFCIQAIIIRYLKKKNLLKGDQIYKSLRSLQYLHLICSCCFFYLFVPYFVFVAFLKNIFLRFFAKNDGH